ncbi:glycosyltransferase family 1 protein [Fulvivirgaceae bacterium BMA10]|uniref:Glycosyltransferase family 1 protein n=1 Tax=Splendidivirga corallicola TaxID=3051826 RepID=A0ABT8KJN5_9BACT|nr:glycosyltransferase family 1 protein [Fulvivirgaceae bacterium BMA10]
MNIGFDAKRAFLNFTGLGNYSRFILASLSEYFPDNNYHLYTPKDNVKREVRDLTQASNIHVRKPSGFISLFKLSSIWRSYWLGSIAGKEHMNIFHGLSNELPFSIPGNLKTVVTIHDLIFLRFPELYKPIDRKIYTKKFKHACEVADKIIAVSQQTAEDIQEFFGTDPSRIEVIYQGCHPNFKVTFEKNALEEAREKYELPQRFLLNVGTIEPRKNALLILKALTIIKDRYPIPLVIVGRSTPYEQILVRYIRENGLEKQVKILHQVSFEDLPKIYQLSQLFIYPSVFEGFGIPIIEALYSKKPVISSRTSCLPEAGGPGSLYIDPTSPEELANAIANVLDNDEVVNKMIQDGLNYIERFENQKIARDLMAVYQKLV